MPPESPTSEDFGPPFDKEAVPAPNADGGTTPLVRGGGARAPGDSSVSLRAEGLVKRYGSWLPGRARRTVVDDVSIEVRPGEIVGLLGPNGAGKTTTFYMIVGLVRPDAGRIHLGEREVTRLPMYRRARLGVGYLAQEASIFQHLTVEQNLLAVLEFTHLKRSERQARAEQLLAEFGLEKVRRSKGYMLSGGERRRTEIARALATDPTFLLLDEPFAGIDPIAVEDIMRIVAHLKDRGIGVLVTDHNVHETLAITDRAYLMYEGRIFTQGTAEELAEDEEARRRYLGERFTLERYQR
ncbi:MAG TPA: LPS export ABC transporter ATP-binding protein [Rhodothermales bacterium]|nr:LPS export ABC transporter ATP-binding protein [Rhodothermales bacterium]